MSIDITKPIERKHITSLVGKTISAVQLMPDGETVKIYDQDGNVIISVNAKRLFDGDGFHFDLPSISERMIQYKVICYGVDDRQLSNNTMITTAPCLTELIVAGLTSLGHEYHVIFVDSKGQDRVAFCTRRRLNEIEVTAFTAELLAFLSL